MREGKVDGADDIGCSRAAHNQGGSAVDQPVVDLSCGIVAIVVISYASIYGEASIDGTNDDIDG